MKMFDCLKISTAIIEREMNVKSVNFKKIASLVLVVTLVLSMIAPVPAAAAELKQAAEAELSVEQKLEEQQPEEQQPEEEKPEEQQPEEQMLTCR